MTASPLAFALALAPQALAPCLHPGPRLQMPAAPPSAEPALAPATSAGPELPPATPAEARRLWGELLAAALPTGGAEPVTAFDLRFDARVYSGERGSNDIGGRYRFLAPNYVRTLLEKSQRETLRGPDGDWLVFADGRAVELVGRDYELDVEELDRAAGVARSFALLTDPRAIRVARLELLPGPPSSIPDELAKRAQALDWLLLETPDFAPETGEPAPGELQRIELGLERDSHLPSLVVLRSSELGPRGLESAQLLELSSYRALDGYRVPHAIVACGPDESTSPWTFDRRRPTLELYVEGGTLRPKLTAKDFQPR